MNRIVGLETEYGCLISEDQAQSQADAWPVKVKNYLFRKCHVGAIDLHYRDYEEPPGNGGFLLNGGRLYLDMGHLEYSSPECLNLRDLVSFDIAGDLLLNQALTEMGAEDQVAFLKNNVDHHTGATFGCHENYLMHREAQFTPEVLASLLAFLATRQIFAGAGRVGQANPLAFDFELPDRPGHVNFQISQRADHIVNDIYQWVQFNRAIINARDEPLADYRKYRRLHLLIGDSNMSPFATALKVGTTVCVLTLLEENLLPTHIALRDAVLATREISRDPDGKWLVEMDDGTRQDALDIQYQFLEYAHHHLCWSGRGDRLDSGELEFHARRHPEQAGAADRRRRLDLEKMATEHLHGGRRIELAGSLVAKSRPRIPQHQSEQGFVFCLEAGQGHWRIQCRGPAGGIDPDSATEHPGERAITSSRPISKTKPPLHHQLGFHRVGKPGLSADAGSV